MTMSSMISFTEKVGKTAMLTIRDEKQTANNANTGLGFIMLLSGEPGVGKTLTAESGTLTQSDTLSHCVLLKDS